jgi:hypothetical protein
MSIRQQKLKLIAEASQTVAQSYLVGYLPPDPWTVAEIDHLVLDKVFPHLHRMQTLEQAVEVFHEVTGYWPYMFLTQQQLETLFVVLQKYLRLMITETD